MDFVTLIKFRRKLTKDDVSKTDQIIKSNPSVKVREMLWTFGQYDGLLVAEAPDVDTYMQFVLQFSDYLATETLVAVPREKALKLAGLR
ncbi:MAG: GYD domain-containing protein [Candidatus Caldarchaeum sp.]|nr:GYD domain-containing protein [Candidatus Caldarchaeum sp.]MCS7133740.1 GYD domain-containing protein [Candidatus Caldarchaeum sp.]MCX8201734.1 GYD domain-containing protein [Candidatus Caldarchaeum sp.]MDW8063454.1 GYD domain-containing protein [Candidatus Caldarchaeum sp.]MDW8434971.1 GYD domain-containing protein [Candidatus Caldarchaeum sp.]